MLKKRIIACMDIAGGRVVKGVNFVNLRDSGDPVELASLYARQGIDELVFLDITATVEKRKTLVNLVRRLAEELDIPFAVGGGISSVEDAAVLLQSGADKISVNSAAVARPGLITDIAGRFGSQAVILAVDAREKQGNWWVTTHGGRTITNIPVLAWVQRGVALGAGEILLTSMAHDGTRNGFANTLNQQVCESVPVPVIASGGAGNASHFTEAFRQTDISAALAAGIFHDRVISIKALKKELQQAGVSVRKI